MSSKMETNQALFTLKDKKISVRTEKDKLILKIEKKTKENSDCYKSTLSLPDLIKISKFFRINDNISESYKEIVKLIRESKINLIEENKLIKIKFSISLATITTFQIPLYKDIIEKNDFSSNILTEEEKEILKKFIGTNRTIKLLYRATRDGDKAENFYEKCENKGPTLILIETKTKRKFGGYTSLSWKKPIDQKCIYYKDDNAFLFSLNKKKKYLFGDKGNEQAVCMYQNEGPAFGGGNDFFISSGCLSSSYSYNNCPYTYKTSRCELNAGHYNFEVKDYEVYSIN